MGKGNDVTDVRQRRIEKLRERIERGEYDVSAEALADAVVARVLRRGSVASPEAAVELEPVPAGAIAA